MRQFACPLRGGRAGRRAEFAQTSPGPWSDQGWRRRARAGERGACGGMYPDGVVAGFGVGPVAAAVVAGSGVGPPPAGAAAAGFAVGPAVVSLTESLATSLAETDAGSAARSPGKVDPRSAIAPPSADATRSASASSAQSSRTRARASAEHTLASVPSAASSTARSITSRRVSWSRNRSARVSGPPSVRPSSAKARSGTGESVTGCPLRKRRTVPRRRTPGGQGRCSRPAVPPHGG